MWNQNNGNGQGNGYGAQDVYSGLNNTREVGGARFPFLEDSGKYALVKLEEFMHSTDRESARALFKVLESKTGKHPVGSYVVKIWKLVKPPFKPGMETDADRFADFARKLKGAPAGHPIGNDIRVLMKERAREQLARGTVIEAVAVPNQKGTWINIYWNTVPQQPADIAAMRQRLEAEGIPDTGGGPQQASPQAMAQAYPANPAFQQQAHAQPQQYGLTQTAPQQFANQYAMQPQQPAQPQQPTQPQQPFLQPLPPGTPNGGQGGNNGQGGIW